MELYWCWSMKPSNKILSDLESLINKGLEDIHIPYQKGNSIRIGHFAIRENSKKGFYMIYDLHKNSQVARTFCKSSAVAIAKKLAQGQNCVDRILSIDKTIQKNYNDAVFYKYTIKVTKDALKREITETRYDIAKARTQQAKNELDKIIFG